MVDELGLSQDYDVKSNKLYRPDGLCEPETPFIVDLEGPMDNNQGIGIWQHGGDGSE